MVMLDLFSGTGGFSKGIMDAGVKFSKHYFSEVNKHAIANYQYNFKDAEYVGSVENIILGERPGIITFGSPCQGFSVAGKGKGVEDSRSGLIKSAIALVDRYRPDIFIWENVKGVISSRHREDFWGVLQALANLGDYWIEWQLLNTKWFLPQNRERVYVIGHRRGTSGGKVFPFREREDYCNERSKCQERDKQIASCLLADSYNKWRGNYILQIKQQGVQKPSQQNRIYDGRGQARCLSTDSRSPILSMPLKYKDRNQKNYHAKYAGCIDTLHTNGLKDGANLRRFTEIECERLHGFPDNWTKYGQYEGEVKEISATQRYKMTGNAVSPVVVTEIAKRLWNQ